MIAQKDISRNTNGAISTGLNKRNSQSCIDIDTSNKTNGGMKVSSTAAKKEKDQNMHLISTDETD